MKTKRCSKCGSTKPVSMFNKNKAKPDGLHSECKECRKQYYTAHKKHIQQYRKEYCASPKGKMIQAIAKAKRRGLGFELLYPLPMKYFRYPHNFCFHHVDNTHVVCIPHRLHKIDNSKKHRELLTPFVKVYYFDYIYPDVKI